MDEDDRGDRGNKGDVAPHVVMDGPPWGGYVDPDLAYIRGQLGSVGSGALGGRSASNLGGFVEGDTQETAEVIAEARRILEARAEEHASDTDGDAGSGHDGPGARR